MSVKEQYEKRVNGEGTSPSGQLFRWRLALPIDNATIFGGMPGLSEVKDGKVDADLLAKSTEYNEKLVARCVTWPRIVLNGSEVGEEDLPASIIPLVDMNWLVANIMGSYRSKAAEDARGAL